MLKQLLSSLFFVTIAGTAMAQKKHIVDAYTDYHRIDGRISGKYISYYPNGTKKAEGEFINGYHTGKWCVWDSTGRKRMERIYKNPLEFTRVFPSIPQEGAIPMLIKNQYKMERDSNGNIKYAKVQADFAIFRHKVWRMLKPENNELIFNNDRLLQTIKIMANKKADIFFSDIDDRFSTALTKEQLGDLFVGDEIKLDSIQIKEEVIFDMERMVSEYRILGLKIFTTTKGMDSRPYWIYYPECRKYFGRILMNSQNKNLRSLDDVFIYRDFSAAIIKSTIDNPYDKFIKDYPGITPEGIVLEQESIELRIIGAEHDIWLSLTR